MEQPKLFDCNIHVKITQAPKEYIEAVYSEFNKLRSWSIYFNYETIIEEKQKD